MSAADAMKTIEACFTPEYRTWASVFTETVERNPWGWETWLALKADEQDERRKAEHRVQSAAPFAHAEHGWFDACEICEDDVRRERAILAAEEAEQQKEHRHEWRRWDSFGDYGWHCDGCCANRDEEPGASA